MTEYYIGVAIGRIRAQLLVGFVLLLLYALGSVGVLPTEDEIYAAIEAMVLEYGAAVVAPISFVENLAGLNAYFPGSVVILSTMALAAGNAQLAMSLFFAIVVPSFAAHQINYLIGKGLRRRRGSAVQEVPDQRRYQSVMGTHLVLATTLWHPHFAALTCIDAGVHGLRYRKFLPLFCIWFLLWNLFWGITMYALGLVLPREALGYPAMVIFLIIWSAWDLLEIGGRVSSALAKKSKNVGSCSG